MLTDFNMVRSKPAAKFSFIGLMAVLIIGEIPRCESGNFPLDGCSTDKFDFIFLYFNNKGLHPRSQQKKVAFEFAKRMLDFDDATSRVQIADVYDSFCKIPAENMSSWKFNKLSDYFKTGNSELLLIAKTFIVKSSKLEPCQAYSYYVNSNLTQRIHFVQHLFNVTGGVRENVTKVAVIFLYGEDLSFEETRSLPQIVEEQQQTTGIKIFVIVFDVRYVMSTVYLRDTLLVGYKSKNFLDQIVIMAICGKCKKKWFQYDLVDQTHQMSCYLLSHFKYTIDFHQASDECKYVSAKQASIETKEELQFVQTQISAYLKDMKYLRFDSNDTTHLSAYIYIGLKRDATNIGKRFHWSQTDQISPVVVNHWLPGKPSGGYSNGCGVWLFAYNNVSSDVINISSNGNSGVDGWVDVGCRDKIGLLTLCETTLPHRIRKKSMIRIKPATNESLSRALSKGNYVIFGDNIVSVSANIASREFYELLKKSEKELFPVFDCGEDTPAPRHISYFYVCDHVDHCSNRRDEVFCLYESVGTSGFPIFGVHCCDESILPLRWVGDDEVDCNVCGYGSGGEVVNDESEIVLSSEKKGEICAFYCQTMCIHFDQLNNNKTDCLDFEGKIDETVGKLKATDTCYNRLGHRLWAPKCVYLKDGYGVMRGCRDMSHLDNCTDFECPEGYVKCPNTYCIPQHYAFDGTLDCPTGDDENNYTLTSCSRNFACWNSKVCLHPDLVCDGKPDCPHRDDEIDCNMACVEGFRCISGTLTVPHYNRTIRKLYLEKFDKRIRYVEVPKVDISKANLYDMHEIVIINFSHCNLTTIYTFVLPNGLQTLDMSYNWLQTLERNNAYGRMENIRLLNLSYNKEFFEVKDTKLKSLEILDLSHTSMSLINKSFIDMFPNLKHLNLSFTKISSIDKNTFSRNIIYQTLDLRGLSIVDFYVDYFSGLSISQDLFTDIFQLCCPQIRGKLIPLHTCHAPDGTISSCFDLIGINVQRVLLWVVALLAVLLNMTVIGYRIVWDRSILTTGYGLFVTNLGISDFIMGVYLFIIARADYYYRDVYVLYDKSWRESVVCKLAGFLATLSSETSTFCVFLITLDRFLVMKFPFGQVKFSKISKIIALSLSWSTGYLLALTPIVFGFEINSSNAMCLALPLTTERLNGWEFSFAVFVVLNFCLVLLVVYAQRAIFRAMSENRMTRVASRRANDLTVAKQLLLVALANFLCWFPVGLMGLMSLGGHVISNDIYAWTTVLILPINSAANPLMYTIPAILDKWERFKRGESRPQQKST